MAKNPLNRKAYRKYMGLLNKQNKEKKPTEAPKSTTNFVHQMADGRKVDENGEIHNTQPLGKTQPTKELNRQQLRKIQRYHKDPRGRLTPLGKQQRLKHCLNIAIIILVLLIITTYLILFFVG